jgi:hypothetical protein
MAEENKSGEQGETGIPPWFLDSGGQIGCSAVGSKPLVSSPPTSTPAPSAETEMDDPCRWPDTLGGDYELLPWHGRLDKR